MKIEKIPLAVVVLLLVLLGSSTIHAQKTNILDSFTVIQSDGKIYLNWVISTGNSCDGTKIYRSNDQVNFNQIGEILGLCGNTSFSTGYEFVDENPIQNQRNYYRLELGRTGFSEIASLEVINLENNYQVRPNPVFDQVKIYFENENREKYELRLYNINGILARSGFSEDHFFEIDAIGLNPGIYVFSIAMVGKSKTIKGKLLKQ